MTKSEALKLMASAPAPNRNAVINKASLDEWMVNNLVALGFIEPDSTNPLADLVTQLDQLRH